MLVYLSLSINNSVPTRSDANGPLSIPRSYWKYPARTNRKHLIWFADFLTPRLKHFATIFQAAIVAQKFGEELSLLRKCFHIRLSSNVSGVLSSPRHLEKVKIMWFIITPGHGQLLQVVFIFHENEKNSNIILFKYHHTYQIEQLFPLLPKKYGTTTIFHEIIMKKTDSNVLFPYKYLLTYIWSSKNVTIRDTQVSTAKSFKGGLALHRT